MLSFRPLWTACIVLLTAPACFQSVVTSDAPVSAAPDLGTDAGPADVGTVDTGLPLDAGPPDPCDGPPNLVLVDPEPGAASGSTSPLLAVFDRCMSRAGDLFLEPSGIRLRADAPSTTVFDARDLGGDFIDEAIGRDNFLENPACYERVGFRMVPSVVIPPGRYEVRFGEGWVSCQGVRFDAEADPLAASWSFVVEP